ICAHLLPRLIRRQSPADRVTSTRLVELLENATGEVSRGTVGRTESMMMRRQHGSRRRSGESGAALVVVLVLVTVVGVIAAAAIRYAGTSMTASAAFQTRRNQQADAEAAIRTAVQYVKANEQSGGTLAADGTTCPTNFSYPGGTGTVTVAMCPQPGSLTYAGYFRATLLTLAPSGFGILQTKNTTLNVNGNVWSD